MREVIVAAEIEWTTARAALIIPAGVIVVGLEREPADGRLPRQMLEQSHKALRIDQRHEHDPRQRAGYVRVVIDAIL